MIVAYWLVLILIGFALLLTLGETLMEIWESDKMKGPY